MNVRNWACTFPIDFSKELPHASYITRVLPSCIIRLSMSIINHYEEECNLGPANSSRFCWKIGWCWKLKPWNHGLIKMCFRPQCRFNKNALRWSSRWASRNRKTPRSSSFMFAVPVFPQNLELQVIAPTSLLVHTNFSTNQFFSSKSLRTLSGPI